MLTKIFRLPYTAFGQRPSDLGSIVLDSLANLDLVNTVRFLSGLTADYSTAMTQQATT